MQQARGGMGSRKHGTAGRAPRSPRYKLMQTLEANRSADAERAKRQRPRMFGSVREALAHGR